MLVTHVPPYRWKHRKPPSSPNKNNYRRRSAKIDAYCASKLTVGKYLVSGGGIWDLRRIIRSCQKYYYPHIRERLTYKENYRGAITIYILYLLGGGVHIPSAWLWVFGLFGAKAFRRTSLQLPGFKKWYPHWWGFRKTVNIKINPANTTTYIRRSQKIKIPSRFHRSICSLVRQ